MSIKRYGVEGGKGQGGSHMPFARRGLRQMVGCM